MDDKTETIRIQTDGAKQTVGIHTDITFEIDKKNHTKSADGKNAESVEDDDDTEVPIYRGTHTEGDRNDMNRPRDPNDYYMNRANFHGVNDEEGMRYGGAGAGTWVRFLPMANGGWTTERYSESFKPQSTYKNKHFKIEAQKTNEIISNILDRRFQSSGFVPYGIGQRSFQGCICNDRSMWRDVNRRSYGSSTLKPQGTDDKLEYPFSETD